MKIYLKTKARQISILAALLAGFGFGVNSLLLGGVSLLLALVLDALYTILSRGGHDA